MDFAGIVLIWLKQIKLVINKCRKGQEASKIIIDGNRRDDYVSGASIQIWLILLTELIKKAIRPLGKHIIGRKMIVS